MTKTRRGTDVLAPGTRVRVTSDVLAADPADSEFIGREGIVGSGNAGIDVLVMLEGDTREHAFALSELEVVQAAADAPDCPHGYRATDSCPCCP